MASRVVWSSAERSEVNRPREEGGMECMMRVMMGDEWVIRQTPRDVYRWMEGS